MTLKRQSPFIKGFEVIIFTLAIFAIGYYVDKADPLLIHYNFSFLILWLAMVTLFYGLAMGIVMWIVFSLFSFFTYTNDSTFIILLLENLFFVFLFGLFFSNLHHEIDKSTIKNKYLTLRLKELTSAFFTLKISHDKLEAIYITQPASFRFVISEVLENCDHNTPELSANNTLKILKKFFSVNTATIWRVKKGVLVRSFAMIGELKETPSQNDKLVQEAIIQKKAIYLKDLKEKNQTEYIYAVPFLDKRNQVVAVLIVKDIPFLAYNEDTLLKINVVFNYIWTEYKKRASLEKIQEKDNEVLNIINHEQQSMVDFKLEVIRLRNIFDDFQIDSRIYALKTENKDLNKEIEDFFYQNELFEILDQHVSIQCGKNYIHFILFPFASTPTIYEKAKTLDIALTEVENKLRVNILEDGLQQHLSVQNFESLRKKHISVKNFDSLLLEYGCA